MQDPSENDSVAAEQSPVSFAMACDWGRRTLNLSQDATQTQIRARFLDHLQKDDFTPWEESVAAFVLLDQTTEQSFSLLTLPQDVQVRLREAGERGVEDYRTQFFQLPPEERSQEWHRLYKLLSYLPEERQQLERLRPALFLDCEAIKQSDEKFASLFEALQTVALAAPTRLAVVRKACVKRICKHKSLQTKDVDQFRFDFPDWCAVDEGLLNDVSKTLLLTEQTATANLSSRRPAPRPTYTPWLLGLIVVLILMMLIQLYRPELATTVPPDPPPKPIYLPGGTVPTSDESRIFVDLEYRMHTTDDAKRVWKKQSKVSSMDRPELQLLIHADNCSSNQLHKLWPFKSEGLPPVSCQIIREEPEIAENSADEVFLIVRIASDTGEVLYHLQHDPRSHLFDR